MRNKILVLGYFGYVTNQLDGQTVKTRDVYELLRTKSALLGTVAQFDTQQFKFNKLFLLKMIWEIFQCRKLVYLPAQNNLQYIFPIIYVICKLRSVEILYVVIGGWLAEYLKSKKLHVDLLSNIRGILPENKPLKDRLEKEYGFHNVTVLPNFRAHTFTPSFLRDDDVFKIVFMARINREKGIDAVFRLAEHIEKQSVRNLPIIIDFYGPIDKNEADYFKTQIERFEFVTYKGILEPYQINETLEKYDLSILPTKYPGEGFPGTILDSYASGLPVIVSNWKYLPEYVDQGETGFIFDLDNEEEFYEYVDKLYLEPDLLFRMKRKAFEKSKLFSPEKAWQIIKKYLIYE